MVTNILGEQLKLTSFFNSFWT